MNQAPAVEVHIVQSRKSPGGMGEARTSAIVPAVANAIFCRNWHTPAQDANRHHRVEAAGVTGKTES
jgi:hypothetical protein